MRTGINVVLLGICCVPAMAADETFIDLGPQITSTLVQGTTFTKLSDSRDLVCTVIRGQPAKLLIYELATGKLLWRLPLEDAHGAWNATTATDGSVYVGTDDNGHLYRWIPGETAVKDLGQVAPGQTFVWEEEPGRDGEVFVSTYPGCQIIRYHPKVGFSDVGHGAVAPGENYARSLALDPASGKIYVGVGAHAHLIELDPKTGEKKNILPDKYSKYEFCYTVNLAGGKLFALPTNPPQAIVMDPATHEVEATLPDVQPQMVMSPKSPDDDKVYFNSGGKLAWYDVKTRKHETVPIVNNLSILGMTWIKPADTSTSTLAIFDRRGRITLYHPASGKTQTIKADIPPEPTPLHSICLGPDGRIYTGGYLSGGVGAFDPKTSKSQQFGGISQSEGMSTLGSRVYFGIYPHARLTWFDTSKPWDGKTNPHQFDHLDRVEQDRPIAVLGVKDLNKVFYGTVPDYGKLGGLLAVVDGESDKVETYRNIVPDQSIVSLVWADGLIVGGTTISGGLGIAPKAREGEIFLWDPKQNEVIFHTAPVPGAQLISGLVVGPDKNIWGIGDGVLFIFDMNKRAITFTRKLFDVDVKSRHAGWRDATMLLHPSADIYGTLSGRLFKLDPKTRELTVLRESGIALLSFDRDGNIYFRQGTTHLWRYRP